MTIELPPLDSEPLVYFLVHSGLFVAVMGAIFFLIGLMLGRVSWGKYKGRARALAIETEAQRNEIADLKRKLAEQHLRPLPELNPLPAAAPQTPAPAAVARSESHDVLTMPELTGVVPQPEPPKPAVAPTLPRPKPAAIATAGPARPVKTETPAIAPFSFLSEETAQPRTKG